MIKLLTNAEYRYNILNVIQNTFYYSSSAVEVPIDDTI